MALGPFVFRFIHEQRHISYLKLLLSVKDILNSATEVLGIRWYQNLDNAIWESFDLLTSKVHKKKIRTPDCSLKKIFPLPFLILLLILLDVDFLKHERIKDCIIKKKRERRRMHYNMKMHITCTSFGKYLLLWASFGMQ